MKRPSPTYPLLAALVVSGFCLTPVAADLPTCPDKPWDRYFAGMENRKYKFTMDPWASGKLIPMGKSGRDIGHSLQPSVTFIIEEIQSNGKSVVKKIITDSLETQDKAITKQGKATFTAKVTGDASFEAHLEIDKGTIVLGGRLLDPGTLTKQPLRFGVRIYFPSAYKRAKQTTKDEVRKFAKQAKSDHYSLVWTDGKQARFNGLDKLDPESKAANGPGIAKFKVDVDSFQGAKFELEADPNSKMLLSARKEQPFHEGFYVTWSPDPVKDPEGKARVRIRVR